MLNSLCCACLPVLLLSALAVVIGDVAIDVATIALLPTVLFVVALTLVTHHMVKRATRCNDITITLRAVLQSMAIRLAAVMSFAVMVSTGEMAVTVIAVACTAVAISIIAEAFTFVGIEDKEPLHA